MQSKKHSAIEVVINTAIGFIGSWSIAVSVMQFYPGGAVCTATIITALCTVWSLARGYVVRRYFARRT